MTVHARREKTTVRMRPTLHHAPRKSRASAISSRSSLSGSAIAGSELMWSITAMQSRRRRRPFVASHGASRSGGGWDDSDAEEDLSRRTLLP